jgi:DNA-binding protein YbaB
MRTIICVRREKREKTVQRRADTLAAREAKKREDNEELARQRATQEGKENSIEVVADVEEEGREIEIPEEVIENNANEPEGKEGSDVDSDVVYDES